MTHATRPVLRARQARVDAGFTLERAARRLGIRPSTLLRFERQGFPEWRARMAAALYRVPVDDRFLGWDRFTPHPGDPVQNAASGRRRPTRRPERASGRT